MTLLAVYSRPDGPGTLTVTICGPGGVRFNRHGYAVFFGAVETPDGVRRQYHTIEADRIIMIHSPDDDMEARRCQP